MAARYPMFIVQIFEIDPDRRAASRCASRALCHRGDIGGRRATRKGFNDHIGHFNVAQIPIDVLMPAFDDDRSNGLPRRMRIDVRAEPRERAQIIDPKPHPPAASSRRYRQNDRQPYRKYRNLPCPSRSLLILMSRLRNCRICRAYIAITTHTAKRCMWEKRAT